MIFALGICLLLLSGCVATAGPDYGYYPPVQPYGYGYARPYYAPRPVIVRPYRQPYRSNYGAYHGDGGRRGGGYQEGNPGGGYHGGGHSRSRGRN
jgi:hypothetical protein